MQDLGDAGPPLLSPRRRRVGWIRTLKEVKGVQSFAHIGAKRHSARRRPLTLHFGEPSGTTPATVLVDRALIRASLNGDLWIIHASYLLRQLGEPKLDLQLPGPPSALQLRVTLDGRQVDWQAVEDSDHGDPNRHVARLRLATELVKRPAVLDVVYQMSPGRGAAGVFQTALTPPLLAGDLGQAPTRWEVTLPPGWLALGPEVGAAAPWTVAFRNLLLTPQLGLTSADLERWFSSSEVAARGGDATAPNLVSWQGVGEPVIVTKVWQPFWLLFCSLALLALGLRLFLWVRQAYAGRAKWAAVSGFGVQRSLH